MAIRIVLAEDNYLVREGVRRLLEGHAELEPVATCHAPMVFAARRQASLSNLVLTSPGPACLPDRRLDHSVLLWFGMHPGRPIT